MSQEGLTLTPELKARLWEAIQSLSTAPEPERTLTGLSLLLQDGQLISALKPYTLEGPYGRRLDADRDTLNLSGTVCFEMDALMQSPAAALPVIQYLFHRLERRFDGRPTLLLLDEAWLFLDNEAFSKRLREWLKTLRKKNVAVVFATQSLSDVANASISSALIESCPTRIFLANERASEPQSKAIYRQFGLNDRQIDLISRSAPKRDYYYQSPAGCRVFDLDLGPIALGVCGASGSAAQTLLDRISAETEADDFAPCWLIEQDLAWAADLLARWPGRASKTPPPPQLMAAE